MSQRESLYEARRWWLTAQEDLEAAKTLHETKKFSHACFLSQQSAEKAVKALWFAIDGDPWGHSIQKLVMQFPQQNKLPNLPDWLVQAAYLDKFYIPTRYPNGLPDLTPSQVYNSSDSLQAIEKAEFFLEETNKLIKELDFPNNP
jgi:HEPN domain-containing protein